MLAIGRVVSRVRRSRVIGDSVEIIDGLPSGCGRRAARRGTTAFGFGGEIGEIEHLRKVDERREFGPERASGEALQVEY